MKNKLILTLFLLATAVTAYYFYIPPSPQISPPAPNNSSDFLFGAIQTYRDNYGPNPNNYGNYQALGFNFWHTYIGAVRINNRWQPKGYISVHDSLETPVSRYEQDLKDEMKLIQPHNQSRLLWQRPKIEWLCYGQRSDYQCENISSNHPLWFYSFQEKNGETMRDFDWNNGDSVLYCSQIHSGPGAKIVIKRLKANTEQSNNDNSITAWRGDNECDWLIKPRIRIVKSIYWS